MALTHIQRDVCRLLARQRIASGESYLAGGVALNTILNPSRISQDLDLFHDTAAALATTWNTDRETLLEAGYELEIIRERPALVEAIVRRMTESVILQWTHDSAFRFFPLIEHPELGLTLHGRRDRCTRFRRTTARCRRFISPVARHPREIRSNRRCAAVRACR
jgi:hypothetical protein